MVAFTEKAFESISAGTHTFRCYGVVDLGTQQQSYQGETWEAAQVNFLFEFPDEKMEDGRPFAMRAAPFNFSVKLGAKSKLLKFLKDWLPSETMDASFDFQSLIGKTGLANVVEKKSADGMKTFANIASVMPVPKGTKVAVQHNDSIFVSLDERWDAAAFDKLGQYYQDQIKDSPEYNKIMDNDGKPAQAQDAAEGDEGSSIPF